MRMYQVVQEEENTCQDCEEIQHKLSDTSVRTDDSGQFSGSSANVKNRRPCSTRPQSIVQEVSTTTTTLDFLYKGRFFTEDDNGNEK